MHDDVDTLNYTCQRERDTLGVRHFRARARSRSKSSRCELQTLKMQPCVSLRVVVSQQYLELLRRHRLDQHYILPFKPAGVAIDHFPSCQRQDKAPIHHSRNTQPRAMVDLQTLCRTTPPVAIADELLGLVNARMRTFLTCDNPEDSADETIQFLLVGLSIHASKSLQYLGTLPPTRTDLLPLEALNQLVNIGPHSLEAVLPTLVLDAILAYPTHVSTVSQLITGILANNAPVATAFRQEVVEATVRLLERENSRILKIEKGQDVGEINLPRLAFSLLVYSRAHPTLASAIVSSRNLFEILKVSYEVISGLPESSLDCTRKVQSKSHLLLLLHTLLEPLPPSDREWKLEMMEEQGQKAEQGTMVDTGISHDYHLVFQGQSAPSAEITTKAPTASIGEKQMDALRSLSSGMKLHTHREDETYMIKVSADVSVLCPVVFLAFLLM